MTATVTPRTIAYGIHDVPPSATPSHSDCSARSKPSNSSMNPSPSNAAPPAPYPIHRPAPLSGPTVSWIAYSLTYSTTSPTEADSRRVDGRGEGSDMEPGSITLSETGPQPPP